VRCKGGGGEGGREESVHEIVGGGGLLLCMQAKLFPLSPLPTRTPSLLMSLHVTNVLWQHALFFRVLRV
jgi:hypothetical protein